MAKPFEPAIHCTVREYLKIEILGSKVIAQMTLNVATFGTPDPAMPILSAAVGLLNTKITAAKSGDHQKIADMHAQCEIVFAHLNSEKAYVKKVANGSKAIILLSGFDASEVGGPKVIPPKMVIDRIEKGPTENSVKIFLKPISKVTVPTDRSLKSVVTGNEFIVDMSPDYADPNSYKEVLATKNSRKLIVLNVSVDHPQWFKVAARNSRGQGPFSDPVKYP